MTDTDTDTETDAPTADQPLKRRDVLKAAAASAAAISASGAAQAADEKTDVADLYLGPDAVTEEIARRLETLLTEHRTTFGVLARESEYAAPRWPTTTAGQRLMAVLVDLAVEPFVRRPSNAHPHAHHVLTQVETTVTYDSEHRIFDIMLDAHHEPTHRDVGFDFTATV